MGAYSGFLLMNCRKQRCPTFRISDLFFVFIYRSCYKMLRKIYYILPPSIRFLARRLYYFPRDVFCKREGLPPRGLIYTGDKEFVKQGNDWVDFFIRNCGLKKEDVFLDIGSGIGRIAIPLSNYLTGKYDGFDAIKKGIDWCTDNIANKHPNFSFHYVPLYNDLYNSTGIKASTYRFPYKDNSYDMACAISVFTHMTPDEVENYLQEAYRILKSNGYLVATFFILDDESRKKMQGQEFDFKYDYGHYALMDKKVKSANVGYDIKYLLSYVEQCGFTIEQSIKGFWSAERNGKSAITFQDVLVLRK